MVNKKIENTFNPLTLTVPVPKDVSIFVSVCLFFDVVACVFYACLLPSQGRGPEGVVWLFGFGVLVCVADMAHPFQRLAATKRVHFTYVAMQTGFIMLAALMLHQLNPWFVGACVAACLCLHVCAHHMAFVGVVPPAKARSPRTQRNQAIGAASLGLFFVALSPTSLAWLSIPALAGLFYLHGWRLWYCSRPVALSQEQHVDIWPAALNEPRTSAPAWIALKHYIAREAIETCALEAVVARVSNPDALVAYFDNAPVGVPSPHALTQFVKERLCECDPDARMVFDMVQDDQEAARVFARMRSGQSTAPEAFALPELDITESHCGA